MTDININTNNEDMDIFDSGDFVLMQKTKENGEKEFIGGGYKIESYFLNQGIPPMTTLNNSEQSGGKVSSPFENLAVPAGLYYVNMRMPKTKETEDYIYKEHTPLSDDIMDKLYSLIEVDKRQKRKTKKSLIKPKHIKTRKQK